MRVLKILLCAAAGLLLSVPAGASPSMPQGDAAFAARFGDVFFARYWAWNPDYAISQGYYATAGELRPFDARERAGYTHWLDAEITALKGFEPAQLSPRVRADQAILQNELESERWAITTLRGWAWNPSNYNVAEPIALLLNTPYAPLDERLRTLSRRLARVPAYYAAAQANVARPTREHTALAIEQNAGVAEVLGGEFEQRLGESTLPKAEIRLLRQRATAARAAAAGYIAFLKALDARQAVNGQARSFRLGAALYAPKFTYDIQSGDTAEALYQRALAEKARLHARMAAIADELWPRYFPDETPPAAPLEKIGRLIGRLSERHTTADGFVDEVKRQIPALEAWVRDHDLMTLDPEKPLQVRETPKYLQGVSIASISAPGPYDPTANTYYNVSPLAGYTPAQAESFLREYNDEILKVLNAHEAVPGHYVQLIYANKSPSRIKSIFGNGAMIEGWAVYSERMMLESGYGGNTPELWLMYSKWNLRVVCNTILDYGVHVLGMSEADAMKLLTQEAFQSETEARGKWRRVQLSQVQLTSYFAGYSAIWDYREKLEAELAERFDLKRFHEAFLSYGSSPVSIIKTLMRPEDAAQP